jgi:hypothetical protein
MHGLDRLRAEIRERSRHLLERLADGDDLPPGRQLRLEGLLEAAALLGADPDALRDDLEHLHREVQGESLAARLGDDWRQHYPFPQLPLFMRRAPVTPTTAD